MWTPSIVRAPAFVPARGCHTLAVHLKKLKLSKLRAV